MVARAKTRSGSKLRVGQTVTYTSAGYKRRARVIEDRGNLGVGGRQIVRIQLLGRNLSAEEPFELPADDLKPVK
jgi:hypothetical protein